VEINLISKSDARLISDYYLKNSCHFKEWEPTRESDYHSISAWEQRIAAIIQEQEKGLSSRFLMYDDLNTEIIGVCSLTNIVRGPFQACNIGYSISECHQGKGLMKYLCRHVISHAFEELNLNRVMANYMPRNIRSGKLLQSLGFTVEGEARKYLKINGRWEDHVLTSIVSTEHKYN